MKTILAFLGWPFRVMQGGVSNSAQGKLSLADWIGAIRVKIYAVTAIAADYVYEWLHGLNSGGMPWYWIIGIGLVLGILELMRKRNKDYTAGKAQQ